jgi:replicative DNA helicase
MLGEVPASRRDCELNVVGSLLFDVPGAAAVRDEVFACLSGREFASPDVRRLFEVARQMNAKGEPLSDPAVFVDRLAALPGGDSMQAAAALVPAALEAVPHFQHGAYYAGILRGLHQRDELRLFGQRLQATAGDLAAAPEDLIAEALQQLEALQAGAAAAVGLRGTAEALADFEESLKTQSAIPSGVRGLDDILGGGLRAGQLCVVAGRPSGGKSAFMQQWAQNCAESGKPVFFVSAEMRDSELAGRAIESVGRERWLRMPIRFSETAALATAAAEMRLAVRRYGVQLVCADYLQILQAEVRGRNSVREQEVAAVSRGLKRLAIETRVPVLAGAQLNRESEKRDRPGLADLRESGAIEQDADIVLMLKGGDDDGSGVREVELTIAKNRNGPRGLVRLNFDTKRFTFEEQREQDSRPAVRAEAVNRSQRKPANASHEGEWWRI